MKTNILKYSLGLLLLLVIAVGCTKDFEEMNTDPNRPKSVPTASLLASAQKTLSDDIFDEWFSGRQGLLWSQFWAQVNYTSEDRFSIRQNTNSAYWRAIYTDMMDLEHVKKIASDPSLSTLHGPGADAKGQIAIADIMECYVFQLLASTYGDIPYEEAFDAVNHPSPAYSTQKAIFLSLFSRLKESADYLESLGAKKVIASGDLIYNGDAVKWAKFANSLRLKLAIRLSKVTDAQLIAARTAAIDEAKDGAFTSNADNAQLKYLGDGISNHPIYDAYYTSNRNDFTITAQFVDLLKGLNDTLNNKVNPFNGLTDPRLSIWVSKNDDGEYRGIPYGLSDKDASDVYPSVANMMFEGNPVLAADAPAVWMDYSEVCFILSEINNWDNTLYKAGVKASLERWGVGSTDADAYVASLPAADQKTVLTQKYIALYMNGYEAWAEWRRTGYPASIIEVGELTGPTADGAAVEFEAIIGDGIPRRLTYTVQEYTLHKAHVDAAATSIGGDEFSTRLIWDKP